MERFGWYLFRLSISSLFLYFGILAVLSPQVQAQIWIAPKLAAVITPFVSLSIFMVAMGVLQIIVGLSIVFGFYYKLGLAMGAAILVGVIGNLAMAAGFNDIVLRDLVILSGIVYLLTT